jgi:hypothetical protein
LDESEPGFWHDEMEKAALTADRTVAFEGFYPRRRFDLELYPAAMASTAVFHQVNLEVTYSA